jgi:hypothetical protein
VDKPLPDDFDPHRSEQSAYAIDDAGDDEQEDEDGGGKSESTHRWPKRPTGKPAPKRSNSPHENRSMIKALFEFFIPPRNDDPETHRRWRIAVGFAVFVLSCSTLLSYGIFKPLGFQGFASAETVKSIEIELLEQRTFDTRLLHCNASTPESRKFYAGKVQELLSKFRAAGLEYRLPRCEEVR